MHRATPTAPAEPRSQSAAHPALRTAAIAAILATLAWFTLPTLFATFTEGFESTIGINALELAAGRLADVDLLYPFNGRFFLITRFGAAVTLAGLHTLLHLSILAATRAVMLGSLALLVGATVAILARIYRVHPAWAAGACLLFPPVFVTTYFFNDNELSAGLSTLALLLFWRPRSLLPVFAAAIALGLAVATRPDAAFLAPAFATLLWFDRSTWRDRLLHAAVTIPIVAAIPLGLYAAFGLSYLGIFPVVARALAFWNNDESLRIYVQHAVTGLALPAFLALPLGLLSFALRRSWRELCLCVATPLLYLLAYGRALHELRYLLPLTPFFAIAVAEGGRTLFRTTGLLRTALVSAFALLFLLCFFPPHEVPTWRLGIRADDDGPRPFLGQAWTPLVWLRWQADLNAGIAAIDHIVEQPGPLTVLSDDWTSDRMLDLTLLEHGFRPDPDLLPPACHGIAEAFRRGPATAIHIRTHIPFLQTARPQITWTLAGLPCAEAAAPGAADLAVIGWRPTNFDPPGLRPEDGVIPLFRPRNPPRWRWAEPGLTRSVYTVSRAPLGRIPALIARDMDAPAARAAANAVARREELQQ